MGDDGAGVAHDERRRSRRALRVVLWVVGGIVSIVALGVMLLVYALWNSFGPAPPLLTERMSPSGLGSVSLLTDHNSFGGTGASVYARDPDHNGGRPFLIDASGSDGYIKMQDTVWSKDGSVIAVRSGVGESSGKQFRVRYGTFFVAAWDYRRNRLIDDETPVRARSTQIETLLRQRGGKGRAFFRNPYTGFGKPMSAEQLSEYGLLEQYGG